MAMTLRKRVPRPQEESSDSSPVRKRPNRAARRPNKPAARRSGRWTSRDSDFQDSSEEEEEEEEEEVEEVEEEIPEYEKLREQRMRENKEKMEKLGIFSLSHNFKPPILPRPRHKKKPSVIRSISAAHERARRSSSRLKDVGRVTYFKNEGTLESMGISVPEGWAPEVYTEQHQKLLGDSQKPWTLFVDGYEDGERLYDPLTGKMCHQCRQKTVGNLSICRKCKSPQGQICGDCLYTRYGENVLEVNENLNWACPSCRDICNCSRCRRAKGWAPTVCVYEKVIEQGHKSIAHYLIHSRSWQKKPEESVVAAADVNTQTAPQMIYSDDSSDGSSEAELDGYNSDSSEEVGNNQNSSVVVLDDQEEAETLEVGDEVLDAEPKDAEGEQEN